MLYSMETATCALLNTMALIDTNGKIFQAIPMLPAKCYDKSRNPRKVGPKKKWRSFIRVLGSSIPMGPAERVYFHPDMIGSNGFKKAAGPEDSHSEADTIWRSRVPLTFADINWLMADTGEAGITKRIQILSATRDFNDYSLQTPPIRHKFRNRSEMCTCCSQQSQMPHQFRHYPLTPSSTILPGSSFFTPCSHHSQKTSTPLNDDSAIFVTPDQGTNRKIEELEVELSKLREQLATIVFNQDIMIAAAPVVNESWPIAPLAPPPPPPPGVPPPPPPPPPPPVVFIPKLSVSEIILQNKRKNGTLTDDGKVVKKSKKDDRVDMAEVLKGIGAVKLRSVARSPGGTPIRKMPKPTNSQDPAALIAQALKKKFAHRKFESPEFDKENTRFSPSPSPQKCPSNGKPTPPGPHLLKGMGKRRLIRHANSNPLGDVNKTTDHTKA